MLYQSQLTRAERISGKPGEFPRAVYATDANRDRDLGQRMLALAGMFRRSGDKVATLHHLRMARGYANMARGFGWRLPG